MATRVPGGYNPAAVAITGGTAIFSDGTAATPSISFASSPTSGFSWGPGGSGVIVSVTGVSKLAVYGADVRMASGEMLGWASGAPDATAADTQLGRGSAGVVKFASANSFSANGAIATTMTSLGPTGSHTTIQKWLTIQDNGGTVLYIPCY